MMNTPLKGARATPPAYRVCPVASVAADGAASLARQLSVAHDIVAHVADTAPTARQGDDLEASACRIIQQHLTVARAQLFGACIEARWLVNHRNALALDTLGQGSADDEPDL